MRPLLRSDCVTLERKLSGDGENAFVVRAGVRHKF